MSERAELNDYVANYLQNQILAEVQTISGSLIPINSSTMSLANLLSPDTATSFSDISAMVAPKLFLVFSVLPLSQISYMQPDGQFFSYYTEENETFALYSNTSFVETMIAPNIPTSYNWYTQPVDSNTGVPNGDAISSSGKEFFVNSSWFQEAMSNSNTSYAFVGTGWGKNLEPLFFSAAGTNGGVVSLGLSVNDFADAIRSVNTLEGTLFLATYDDGLLLAHSGNLNGSMQIINGTVSFEFKNDVDLTSEVVNISCQAADNLMRDNDIMIYKERYMFFCAPLEIAGIQSVSVLAFPRNGLLRPVSQNNPVSFWLMVFTVVSMFLSPLFFLVLICRGAKREMILHATLIKQMEATQQAERRSMNKTMAFASASHDIRGSIATIIGLADLCLADISPRSSLKNNLSQMKASSLDLLDLVNSVLDSTKIEVGKMQLREQVFDLGLVIEEAVNFVYPQGVEKGIDVVLDPCDGSIMKSCLVIGDRGKLKQILNNLLSNAVKFTIEGHVILRVWVKKQSSTTAIHIPREIGIWNCISSLFYENKEEAYINALHTVQQNEILEVIFEVDDTGKGIPKEKQMSVFENFVQVNHNHGGTGLGLGIVQSLVRLMGGEINIVNKELGERGTCFRFNIFLSKGENLGSPITTAVRENNTIHQLSGIDLSPIKQCSHVVLLIHGYERTKIIQNFVQNLKIKVSALNHFEQLPFTLKKLKRNFNYLSHFSSSGKSELSFGRLSKSTSHNSNVSPLIVKTSMGNSSPFILIVIDDGVESLSEVCSIVSEFSKEMRDSQCKVVGLTSSFRKSMLPDFCDHIVHKPLHGSCLYEILRLLPEFGSFGEETSQVEMISAHGKGNNDIRSNASSPRLQQVLCDKPLSGKKILLVDDETLPRKISFYNLTRLGAMVECCASGEEAGTRTF
ncbi:histidine kinase CKI1-like [Papaver somniferum]|uniref:histidine kinase CKI1-like n=1 Tax=Papaver somniferum TaxID=3469 RepID=UPI000E7009EB|nr:histidine kinase CKI1-like [Papaver somniferum]